MYSVLHVHANRSTFMLTMCQEPIMNTKYSLQTKHSNIHRKKYKTYIVFLITLLEQ